MLFLFTEYTNAFNFPVHWSIQILCALATAAMCWPDINNSRLYQYVGFEEAHKFWRDSHGYFKYKANLIATAAVIFAFLVIGLTVYPPICFAGPIMAVPRFIYALTKTGKDIKFRRQKQKDFLTLLSIYPDSSDDGLALFFTNNYHGFAWGTDGDKIMQKGDRWTYELFPYIYSQNTDENAAHVELRRALYNLSQKPQSEWLTQ